MTSLHELRAIEQQRIADERAATARAREAEDTARRAAEQAQLDERMARERAARDAELRIEQARADAAREVRMRVEATEAAERARLAAALEHERVAQELELRRADIAKRRPTWMVVVTVLAIAGGVGFGALAIDRMHEADSAQADKAAARADMVAAKQTAAEAIARLDAMQKDLDALDAKVREAQHAVAIATNKIELEHAQQLLSEANRKAAAARQHEHDLQVAKDAAIRKAGFDATKCNGVLGCLDKH